MSKKTTTVKGLERDLLFQFQKLEMFKSILADMVDKDDDQFRKNVVDEIERLKSIVKMFAKQYFKVRKIVWEQSKNREEEEEE